ncbi:MAG: hypothetical protein ABJA20_04310 [Novosphingobium sp.]
MRFKFLAGGCAVLALSGCQTAALDGQPYMGGQDNFGEANRQTYAAQIVDPAPVYETAIPEGSAQQAVAALDRYHADKVKQPDRVKTSNIATDSGASGR